MALDAEGRQKTADGPVDIGGIEMDENSMEKSLLVETTLQAGSVKTDFDQLKQWVEKAVEPYRCRVVTADSIKSDKEGLAKLRKLSDACENERKSIKKQIMMPYDEWADEYSIALAELTRTISELDGSIKAYESKEKQALQDRRMGLLESIFSSKTIAVLRDREGNYPAWLYKKTWLNKSTPDSTVSKEAEEAASKAEKDVRIIMGLSSPSAVLSWYRASGSLADAMDKAKDIEATKALIEVQKGASSTMSPADGEPTTDSKRTFIYEPDPEGEPVIDCYLFRGSRKNIDTVIKLATELGIEIKKPIKKAGGNR